MAPTLALASEEILRYSRHLLLPEVAMGGQQKLKGARVLLVGTGGLGSPLALYLTAAGVGTLGLVDSDRVDLTNLQRQVLFGTEDLGRAKADAARERLRDLNPHVHVEVFQTRLTPENALEILRDFHIVADGSDNFPTRYLVSDACVLLGIPNAYGSIFRFEGQVSLLAVPGGPCYRCLFRRPPPPELVPSCAEGGVLGVLPGLVGTLQAAEILKWILGVGDPLVGRLLLVDAWRMAFRPLSVRPDPRCPACGTREIRELRSEEAYCGTTVGEGEEDRALEVPRWPPQELARRLAEGHEILLLDVRGVHEWEIAHLPGARILPLERLAEGLSTLDSAQETLVYCRNGTRSARAVQFLREVGFAKVWNLEGGLLRWIEEVDPSMPRY